jgi:carbonic anhydrase
MNEVLVTCDVAHQESQALRPFTGGPKPKALIITCSDGSLDLPLTQQFQHQSVFVLRTVGYEVSQHIHGSDAFVEALEEAVCWWQVPRIIVCGHSDCCADRRLRKESLKISANEGGDHSTFETMVQRRAAAQLANRRAMYHIVEQLSVLRSYSSIAERLQDNRIELSAAFYLHESGLFLQFDERRGEFQLV